MLVTDHKNKSITFLINLEKACEDSSSDCIGWANDGYCDVSDWMWDNCQKSCNTCRK